MKKKTKLILSATTPNQWMLKDELTMMSLSENWRALDKARPTIGAWQINFSDIKRMDSAGVAFLLGCIRYSESHKIALQFLNLSSEVTELIEAQGVMSLIQPYFKDQNASR